MPTRLKMTFLYYLMLWCQRKRKKYRMLMKQRSLLLLLIINPLLYTFQKSKFIPGTYFNQDYCNKSVYLLRQLLPLRLQQMNQRLA